MNSIDHIRSISLDSTGVWTIICTQRYPMIYRAAAGIEWVPELNALRTTEPREWNVLRWFVHLKETIESNTKFRLIISEETKWAGVAFETQAKIKELF